MARRPPAKLRLHAAAADAGAALLEFVQRRGGLTPDDARAAIERGGAFVDQRRERDPAHPVRAGALIEVSLREQGQPPEAPQALGDERVLFLDRLVVAVDKPAGVLAQEGRAGGAALPDLVTALLRRRFPDRSPEHVRALLVHRLDRGTTGVTLLARTRAAQAALLEVFRDGRAGKQYRALVFGQPQADQGVVDLPLGEDQTAPGKRRVDPRGEPARTRWQVVERFPAAGAALIAAFPETGRTHQVRVHLASLGCPLLGDARYGGPRALTSPEGTRLQIARPLLHALAIEVPHPDGTGQPLAVQAPEPEDLAAARNFLRAR